MPKIKIQIDTVHKTLHKTTRTLPKPRMNDIVKTVLLFKLFEYVSNVFIVKKF